MLSHQIDIGSTGYLSLHRFVTLQHGRKALWRAELARLRREEQRLASHPSALA
jgi:hypothetical protein